MKSIVLNGAAATALVLGIGTAAMAQSGGPGGGDGAQMRPPAASGDVAPRAEGSGSAGASGGASDRMTRPGTAQGEMKGDRRGSAATEPKGELKSGRAAAPTELSTQQRTVFREKLVSGDADRATADFNVSVGAVVPRTIHVRPLPPELVQIVPEYRDYDYVVLADGRIAVINPANYEIVTVVSG